MATINKITQTGNGNVRLLDASDNILFQVNRNMTVYLDPQNSAVVRIGTYLIGGSFNQSTSIELDPATIGFVGGVAFSGTAQDLIDDLDSYFFG